MYLANSALLKNILTSTFILTFAVWLYFERFCDYIVNVPINKEQLACIKHTIVTVLLLWIKALPHEENNLGVLYPTCQSLYYILHAVKSKILVCLQLIIYSLYFFVFFFWYIAAIYFRIYNRRINKCEYFDAKCQINKLISRQLLDICCLDSLTENSAWSAQLVLCHLWPLLGLKVEKIDSFEDCVGKISLGLG